MKKNLIKVALIVLLIALAGVGFYLKSHVVSESATLPAESDKKKEVLSIETVAGKLEIKPVDISDPIMNVYLNGKVIDETNLYNVKIENSFNISGRTIAVILYSQRNYPPCEQRALKIINKDSTFKDEPIGECIGKYDSKSEGNKLVFTYDTNEMNMIGKESLIYDNGIVSRVKNIKPIYDGNINELKTLITNDYSIATGEIVADGEDFKIKFPQFLVIKTEPSDSDGQLIKELYISIEGKKSLRDQGIKVGDKGSFTIKTNCDQGCNAEDIFISDETLPEFHTNQTKLVTNNSEIIIDGDPESKVKTGDIVKMNTSYRQLAGRDPLDMTSTDRQMEFNCKKNTFRIVYQNDYDKNNKRIFAKKYNGEFLAADHSLEQRVLNYACTEQEKPKSGGGSIFDQQCQMFERAYSIAGTPDLLAKMYESGCRR